MRVAAGRGGRRSVGDFITIVFFAFLKVLLCRVNAVSQVAIQLPQSRLLRLQPACFPLP